MNATEINATFFGATDPGRVRTNNEDNYIACELWSGSHLLLAAIDGIGGYEGGEVAAKIARDVIIAETGSHPGTDSLELLKHAVTKANNAIVEHKQTDPDRRNMGCVISSAIISLEEARVYMVHVGDSRLYQFTATGGLKKLSHDHSLVGYREEIGMLTEEQAMRHPQRNIIERSLGEELHKPDDTNFLDAGIFPILGSTQYLFCSDGLSDMLYSAEIAGVLSSDSDAHTEVTRLIEMANEAGGKDNITVVIAKIEMPGFTASGAPAEECHDTAFGQPLPPADNSDDMIAPDYDGTHAHGCTSSPDSNEADYADSYKKDRNEKPKKLTLKRFNAFVVTIAVSFIIGGTIGYFIGHATAIDDAVIAAQEAAQKIADSVVVTTNNPNDSIADPEKIGQHDADSVNKRQKELIDTSATTSSKAGTKPAPGQSQSQNK